MKKIMPLLWITAACFGMMAAPVSADKPTNFQITPEPINAVNPCTGEPNVFQLFWDVYQHQGHDNNFVSRVVRAGFTSDGFEAFAGGERVVLNKNVVVASFRDMWRSEDGQMFTSNARYIMNLNQGEIKINVFELRCIGGETILP